MPIKAIRKGTEDILVLNLFAQWPISFVKNYHFDLHSNTLTLRFVDNCKRPFNYKSKDYGNLHSALVHSTARSRTLDRL